MISVITFTYNDAAAIEKFLTNTSFADEVIIIDNNSSEVLDVLRVIKI